MAAPIAVSAILALAFFVYLHLGGEKRFEGLQRVFAAVHQRTSERQLSRIAYLSEKPAD